MATKAELEQALELVEDAVAAKTDKEKAQAAKAVEKFEDSSKDKALADKVEEIVDGLTEAPKEEAKAENAEAAPEKKLSKEELAAQELEYQVRLKKVRARAGADYPDR